MGLLNVSPHFAVAAGANNMDRNVMSAGRLLTGDATARREAVAAWTVWLVMFAAGLWFVSAHALTMPYGDEWEWLSVVVGQQPVNLSWLWSMHNEHRLVLPRLIYIGVGRLTGFDFRAVPLLDYVMLGGLAAAMMFVARALRGRLSVYDAFFPLLLLHWGQGENLIWGFQVQMIASTVLAGVVLLLIVRCGPRLSLGRAALVTIVAVALGLCGLNGLVYLPTIACWLIYAAISGRHVRRVITENATERGGRAERTCLISLACVPLALTAVYFVGYHGCNAGPPGVWPVLRTSLQFLSSGIGPAAKEIWPVSGGLIVLACGLSLWQLSNVFRRRPEERVRAAGLLCFLGGVGALALAIGVGRAFAGPRAGYMGHYMTLATPLLCLLYFQCTLYCQRAKIHFQRTLCLLMLGLVAVNVYKGLGYSRYFEQLMRPMEADARVGVAPGELAVRYGDQLAFASTEVFAARLEMLRRARLGPYRETAETPDAGRR